MPPKKKSPAQLPDPQVYRHNEASLALRPEIGAQAHFKRRSAPTKFRFDDSLAPELQWDALNPAREQGEALIAAIERATTLEEAREAAHKLKALSRPFLNWSGKAERLSFDVPALPLFVHERLSTRAILDALQKHKRDRQAALFADLFGAEERSMTDQVLRAYEYRDQWVNRLVLGDSLVVMNSLLRYEHLGGQVQMIYMDPPYGVKFGSNFQPFVRSREVGHNDDEFMTREPETVQAYRDTWELGLHSYLTYLRDRLLLSHELLAPTGSIFVQISDTNLHHVRELLDEVFGRENFIAVVCFQKTGGLSQSFLPTTCDYLFWYAKDKSIVKSRPLYLPKASGAETDYQWLMLADGTQRRMTAEEKADPSTIPSGARVFQTTSLESANPTFPFEHQGKTYNQRWKTNLHGLENLAKGGRLFQATSKLRYIRFVDDFPAMPLTNVWNDTGSSGFRDPNVYVVQTTAKVIERCIHLTTDPGDLVLDPTCGSGTTAYVSEQWGRRWIAIDTSRVPLALARERMLSATFNHYSLREPVRGPVGGFVYRRRQNRKGEEVGGIIPHITLKSIAQEEPPAEEVLVDRPEIDKGIIRVTSPFTVEATIAPTEGLDEEPETPGIQADRHRAFVGRMIEVLQRAPTLRLPGNETLTLRQVRPPARTLALSAEALIDLADGEGAKPVAIVFGPEDGPVSERLVREAWKEAELKGYLRLFVIGFGIDPKARQFVEDAQSLGPVPCVYLQATMDLTMGDLLKNMRSSQVFSVCGLPDVEVRPIGERSGRKKGESHQWQVELKKLNTFDPATMEAVHYAPENIPAWFLDTDYNGMVFRVRQAFFPGTGSWDKLKRELRAYFEDSVWEHLAGTVSEPFEAGEHRMIAVKVIDPRGNELVAIKKLETR
jgi:adenine-specific DNA-methyltransferase